MPRTHGEKFATANDNRAYGKGSYIQKLPEEQTAKFKDFSGGYDASDSPKDVNLNASPWSINTYTDRKDRIARCPGTTASEAFAPRSPEQVMLHPSLDARTEMIFFDAPYLGVKAEGATTFYNEGLDGVNPYVATVYGEDFIFFNGRGDVRRRRPGDTTTTVLTGFPNGKTLATFAGRPIVGGAIIDGNFEPLGIRWPTITDAYDFDGETSGFELLISNDTIAGDRIMALRPMGYDYMAILNRKSVWIGRRTQDEFRPVDFASRETGKGCIAEPTARLIRGGVAYLSDEGVEVFDGNQSVHISKQIDAEILPIDPSQIGLYSASYNPHTQFYYLFTPGYTYVYDCLRNRWHRRDMTVLGGVPFAQQFHATVWGEMVGAWSAQDTIWQDWSPAETQIPDMYFLGDNQADARVLHKELAGAATMMGFAVQFLWGSPYGEFKKNHYLCTHKGVRIEYIGSGTADLYLPGIEGVFEKVTGLTPVVLANRTLPDEVWAPGMHTGMGIAVQIEILTGDPRISEVELDYLQRGQRIELLAFPPREFEADF